MPDSFIPSSVAVEPVLVLASESSSSIERSRFSTRRNNSTISCWPSVCATAGAPKRMRLMSVSNLVIFMFVFVFFTVLRIQAHAFGTHRVRIWIGQT